MSQLRVLVTGGGRGIGRAVAVRFAREGALVAVAARSSDELDASVAAIEAAGGRGLATQMNVVDLGSVEAAVYRALEFTGGGLDVLVNCAGTFDMKPIDRMDLQTWEHVVDVNLKGTFLVTHEALDGLEESERGHVFNVSSQAGLRGFPGNTAYCAAKFGVRGFSDALRLDLADREIRVTTVYPGNTDTAIFDKVPGDWDRSAMNKPEDVAEAIHGAWASEEPVDDLEVPAPTPAQG